MWQTEDVTEYGMELLKGETQKSVWPDISLTIKRQRFGEVGTLVLTERRMIFMVFNSPVAYTFDMSSVSGSMQRAHTAYGNDVLSLEVASADCQFSLQGLRSEILAITWAISAVPKTSRSGTKVKVMKGATKGPERGNTLVGLQKITDDAHKNIKQVDSQLGSLRDIGDLKASAAELKLIAKTLSESTDEATVSEMQKICVAIGVENPVTRGEGGSKFARELAGEFSNVMMQWFKEKKTAIIPVPEAFAAYNRARGTELVSPHDLKEALDVIERGKGKYDIRVEKIARYSVIVKKEASFDVVVQQTVDALGDNDYLTTLMLQKKCGVPNTIAKDYLLRAEAQGKIARDDSLAGLRFYKNKFSSFGLMNL